jgi:predicted ribonuclease toxin of YeeF-YezG toxin-antitoxin module
MINGDAESRSHWVVYALGSTVIAVVGTNGAGTITKTGGQRLKPVREKQLRVLNALI